MSVFLIESCVVKELSRERDKSTSSLMSSRPMEIEYCDQDLKKYFDLIVTELHRPR